MRYANGEATRLPARVTTHLVAARYGQTPDQVRAWPAQDFMDAVSFLGVTRGPGR